MYVLGIDTSTTACSAAIVAHGRLVAEMSLVKSRRQAELLAPMISALFEQSEIELKDIDGVAVTIGPGSFTGLRVGLGVAKGICYAGGHPLTGISTLDALARQKTGNGPVCALVDAKIGKVYARVYERSGNSVVPLSAIELVVPRDLPGLLSNLGADRDRVTFLGDGVETCREVLADLGYENTDSLFPYPRASDVAYLGWERLKNNDIDDPVHLVPAYLAKSRAERLLDREG